MSHKILMYPNLIKVIENVLVKRCLMSVNYLFLATLVIFPFDEFNSTFFDLQETTFRLD